MPKITVIISDEQDKYLKEHYKVDNLDLTMSQIVNDVIDDLVDKEYVPSKTTDEKINEINNK